MTLSTHLELGITKISLILGITILLGSCNAVKNVTQDQLLLTKNTIEVDGHKVDDFGVFSQLTQRPNTKIPLIGIPAGLHLYNLADQQPDSTFTTWLEKKPKREQRLIRLLSKKQLTELGNYYIGFNQWLKKSSLVFIVLFGFLILSKSFCKSFNNTLVSLFRCMYGIFYFFI